LHGIDIGGLDWMRGIYGGETLGDGGEVGSLEVGELEGTIVVAVNKVGEVGYAGVTDAVN
jgi:hypothetical protein